MKKYFVKIFAVALLMTIFSMASNFCFHGLMGSIEFVSVAQAATFTDKLSNDIDPCVEASPIIPEVKIPITPMVQTSHQDSLLPCCVSQASPSVVSPLTSATELTKLIPVVFSNQYDTLNTILISTVYHKPITSPPELLALRSTVLRI